jgi:hypothetical protein
MIHFPCACGRQLQARAADIGRLASCPLCGQTTTVPDRDQPRPLVYPRDQQTETPPAVPDVPPLVPPGSEPPRPTASSKLAAASLVFGVLSFPFLFAVFTSIPAIVTAVLALRRIARSQGQLGGKGSAIAGLVLGCLGLVAVIGLSFAVGQVRVSVGRMKDASQLKQMALAFHNCRDSNDSLPAATAYCTKDGKPGLSWRVAILPYIGEDRLFKQFRLDEPWDSPHNIKLLPRMPKMYLLPGRQDDGSGLTHYQVFVGPETPFGMTRPKRLRLPGLPVLAEEGPRLPASFLAGTANTILIATARDPVPWTKPVDLPYDRNKPLPPLGGQYGVGFNAALADGSVRWIDKAISERKVRDAITSEVEWGGNW